MTRHAHPSAAGRATAPSVRSRDPGVGSAAASAGRLLALVLLAGLGSACATPGLRSEPTEPVAPAPVAASGAVAPPTARAVAKPEIRWGHFAPDLLLDLLTAELSLQRDDADRAVELYADAARASRDIEVTRHAALLANYLGRHALAVELVDLWLTIEPDSQLAPRIAVESLLRDGEVETAVRYAAARRTQLAAAGPVEDGRERQLYGVIALRALHEPPDRRAAVVTALEAELALAPELADLRRALAMLYHADGDSAAAWHQIRDLQPAAHSADFAMLHVELMASEQRLDAALPVLETLLETRADPRLWFLASRFYIDHDQLGGARRAFDALLEHDPEDVDLIFSAGLVALQQQDWDGAEGYLRQLVDLGERLEAAHYYLGEIHRARGDTDDAMQAYENVTAGRELVAAAARWTELALSARGLPAVRSRLEMLREHHPADAVDLYLLESNVLLRHDAMTRAVALLNEAVDTFPTEPELLYHRALALQGTGDRDAMEVDLRAIIAAHPDHAAALNALGYALADQSERLDEAMALIQRAHDLQPDDPAVIDSLGWVHYRLGNYALALELLEAAHAALPDPEVAAHLGEVLWFSGERRRARRFLREALLRSPDSEPLRTLIERLDGR